MEKNYKDDDSSCVLAPLDEPDLGCQRVASLVMRLTQVVDLGESGKGILQPVLNMKYT